MKTEKSPKGSQGHENWESRSKMLKFIWENAILHKTNRQKERKI